MSKRINFLHPVHVSTFKDTWGAGLDRLFKQWIAHLLAYGCRLLGVFRQHNTGAVHDDQVLSCGQLDVTHRFGKFMMAKCHKSHCGDLPLCVFDRQCKYHHRLFAEAAHQVTTGDQTVTCDSGLKKAAVTHVNTIALRQGITQHVPLGGDEAYVGVSWQAFVKTL